MGGKRSWDKRKLGKQNTKKHQTGALLEFKLSSTWDVLPHVLVKSKLHWLLCIMEADLCHWFMAWISAVQLPNHGQRGLISWDGLQFPTVSHSFPVLHQGFSSKMICIAPRSPTEPGDPVCYWILLLLSIYCLSIVYNISKSVNQINQQ